LIILAWSTRRVAAPRSSVSHCSDIAVICNVTNACRRLSLRSSFADKKYTRVVRH
jgi:hypothetical protein